MRLFKKITVVMMFMVITGLSILSLTSQINASSSTTYTYALDDDYEFVRTQDAYLPGQTITFLGLNKPSDIAFNNDNELIISDSGNARVIVYDPLTKLIVREIKHVQMVNPQGVFTVRETSTYVSEGDIYVADPTSGYVFHFDKMGVLMEQFGKPDSIMYETLAFQPERIAVDKAGIMYIVSKGSSDGIVQLSNTGEFLGFFSSNKVTLNWREQLQKFIYSDEQLANLGISFTPPVFTSVFIDHVGVVYSSSSGTLVENLKKHNTQGTTCLRISSFPLQNSEMSTSTMTVSSIPPTKADRSTSTPTTVNSSILSGDPTTLASPASSRRFPQSPSMGMATSGPPIPVTVICNHSRRPTMR